MRSISRLPALGAILLAAALAACEGGAGGEPRPDDAPGSTTPTRSQGPDPVVVTNTAANPVQTAAVGTTAVAGTVAATQGGDWQVTVANPTLAVEGAVSIAGGATGRTQSGAWTVDIGAQPPVALAPGASVAVSALPAVTLAGTPNVNVAGTVAISNTPAVTIASTVGVSGAVAITNGAANPIPVRAVADAQTPWARNLDLAIPAGSLFSDILVYQVPSGKRLVIEFVTAKLLVPSGQAGKLVNVAVTVAGTGASFALPLTEVAEADTAAGVLYVASQLTKIYADPGTLVVVEPVRDATSGTSGGRIALAGYLVDAN